MMKKFNFSDRRTSIIYRKRPWYDEAGNKIRIIFHACCLIFLPIGQPVLFGQAIFSPNEKSLEAHAYFTTNAPVIDGKLKESDWEQAPNLTNFIQIEPHQGKSSAFYTEVRLLYTSESLYVGVYCADPGGIKALRAPNLDRDFPWLEHDTFAIALDGFNDRRNSITFATNPYGTQKDYLSFDDLLFDGAWNGVWRVKTSRTNSGWFAEFEIPFKTLRYPDQTDKNHIWGINFVRLQRASNEISAWSPYPRSFGFNRMEYAGLLKNFEVPEPSSNIQVSPYFLISSNDLDTKNIDETVIKPGGEIKWAVTPNTVIDFTVNTDFAQAEADVQVANVNRFNILFPEKRTFFLENASIFGAGLTQRFDGTGGDMRILPFFSRRIGLDAEGRPMAIDGGVRAVHRSVKRNAGVIYMHQRKSDFSPSVHTAIGRYSHNTGKQNRIGGLATMRTAVGEDSYTNWLGAVDGFFRLSDSHAINTMIMQSGYSDDRPSGNAGYLQYTYITNTIKGWWTQAVITENFKPELGFISREDIIATNPGIYTTLRGKRIPMKNLIRSFQPAIEMNWYHQASTGRLIERKMKLYPFWLGLQNGGRIGYSVSWNYQFLISDFHPLGVAIEPGTYVYNRHALYLSGDSSKKLSYSLQHYTGNYFDGKLASTHLMLTAAPIPHINVQLQLIRNKFKDVGSGNITREINLYTLHGRFALNPQIQLTGLYQRNTFQRTNAFNIRFTWEHNPLSYIYLVFNSREFLDSQNVQQLESGAIVKLTYLKQF